MSVQETGGKTFLNIPHTCAGTHMHMCTHTVHSCTHVYTHTRPHTHSVGDKLTSNGTLVTRGDPCIYTAPICGVGDAHTHHTHFHIQRLKLHAAHARCPQSQRPRLRLGDADALRNTDSLQPHSQTPTCQKQDTGTHRHTQTLPLAPSQETRQGQHTGLG
jgi:hypothetical protein